MSVQELQQSHCEPCQSGGQPFDANEVAKLLSFLPGWKTDGKFIRRTYVHKDFESAVNTIRLIAAVAQKEGHHPDVHLTDYRNLEIVLSTHKVKGLTRNDFILASKIDAIPMDLKS